jgi:hypothetical protein
LHKPQKRHGFVFCLVEEEGCCFILHLLRAFAGQSVFVFAFAAGCLLVVATCTKAEPQKRQHKQTLYRIKKT